MSLKDSEGQLFVGVYTPTLADSIIEPWRNKLNECGISCEFFPEFIPKTWQGLLPLKISIDPTLSPAVEIYGKDPMWAAVDWSSRKYKQPRSINLDLLSDEQKELVKVLQHIKWEIDIEGVSFLTISIRIELFLAATLAYVTGGILHVNDQVVMGEKALQLAQDEVAEFETEVMRNKKFYVERFSSWETPGITLEGEDIPV